MAVKLAVGQAASVVNAALAGYSTRRHIALVAMSSERIQGGIRGLEARRAIYRRVRSLTTNFRVAAKKAGQLVVAARAFLDAQEDALQEFRSVVRGKHANDRTSEDAALLVKNLAVLTPMQALDSVRTERLVQRVEWISFTKGQYIVRKGNRATAHYMFVTGKAVVDHLDVEAKFHPTESDQEDSHRAERTEVVTHTSLLLPRRRCNSPPLRCSPRASRRWKTGMTRQVASSLCPRPNPKRAPPWPVGPNSLLPPSPLWWASGPPPERDPDRKRGDSRGRGREVGDLGALCAGL